MNKKKYQKPEIKKLPLKSEVSILAGPCGATWGFSGWCA
jgi:hypothetical protein